MLGQIGNDAKRRREREKEKKKKNLRWQQQQQQQHLRLPRRQPSYIPLDGRGQRGALSAAVDFITVAPGTRGCCCSLPRRRLRRRASLASYLRQGSKPSLSPHQLSLSPLLLWRMNEIRKKKSLVGEEDALKYTGSFPRDL